MNRFFTIAAACLLLVSTVALAQTRAENRTLIIPFNSGSISIDGDLSDWEGYRIHSLDSDNLVRGHPRDGSSDLSADFWLAWDRQALYFAADIRDDSWQGTPPRRQIWNSDVLIITINSPSLPRDSQQQYFMISENRDGLLLHALKGDGQRFVNKECSQFSASLTPRDAGPLIEGSIGWTDISPANAPPRGLEINVEIRDLDGNSSKSISWLPTAARADGSLQLSAAVLVDPEEAEIIEESDAAGNYRSYVSLVEISAVVTDKNNRYLEDLTKEDFIVLEDGVPQKIRSVQFQQRPVTICLLMDRSGSMESFMKESRRAITHFLRAMREEDRSMLITFNHEIELLKDVAGSAEEAIRSLEEVNAVGGTAFYSAVYFGIRQIQYLREKKVLVVLSDGIDESQGLEEPFGETPSIRMLIEEAKRHQITVYPVAFRIRDTVAMGILNNLARETGGRVLLAGDVADLNEAYADIAEELKSQYHIIYQSDNQNMDGHWRTIEVLIKDREANVRTRPGYYAPSK